MILGAPQSESDNALLYVYEWKLESGTARTQGDPQASGSTGAAPAKTVKATIRADFSDAKLISFDVSKSLSLVANGRLSSKN